MANIDEHPGLIAFWAAPSKVETGTERDKELENKDVKKEEEAKE